MGRASFAIVLPACLVAFALVAGSAACESTLNLSEGDAGPGPDGRPLTCESSCDRVIVTCALFPLEKRSACISQCIATGRQSDLVCVAQTACADIGRVCGDERDGATERDGAAINGFQIQICQSACDSSGFFSCLDASQLSTCRALCATAPAPKRDAYASCASGAGGGDCVRAHDCFDVFTRD